MNRQQRKAAEKQLMKNAASKFAIDFKLSIAENNSFDMLSIIDMSIVNNIAETCDYDNEKCYNIILDSSPNIIAKINNERMGNVPSPQEEAAIQQSMKNVSLALLRMIQLDPYKSAGVLKNAVMTMDLDEDEDGNVTFNPAPGGNSLFLLQKGIAKAIKARKHDVMVVVG